ncbi:DUF4184 family protein [Phycicoccus flavus]|uniref:DUF4184 family protein n=1 Tax=Phycicoccus flavus TaxID=2502783 RepID=UPI000FEC10A1|nr:DUF4184 family protein [Phycicoccus flavus]NHA67255.1 DUF4184 family protein [Phycicoccus flavus]
MPFTPAHVAAVLPALGDRRPAWAVPAALVVGSMVPDVLYFVPFGDHRALSHSLRGVLTLDLALGLAFVALWWVVAAPVLHDLSPRAVRSRTPVPHRPGGRVWLWAVPGVVLGSLTHLAWDGFTHADGWAVARWSVLGTTMGGLPLWHLAQYVSGLAGVALVLVRAGRRLARAPVVEHATPVATPAQRRAAWAVLLAAPVLGGPALALDALGAGLHPELLLYLVVVRGVSAFGLASVLVAAAWFLRRATVAEPRPT